MSANIFIVPHDFTSVGDAALKYALFLAQPRKTSIELLHIVSSKEKKHQAEESLQKIINNLDLEVGGSSVVPLVKVGSIFDDISKIAKTKEARLIIMGTHGAKGMQKLFGSYAMKVVINSSVPFLVIQDAVDFTQIKRITIPITTSKESLQIINVAGEIARTFGAEVDVIAEHQSDKRLSQQLRIRISLVKKQFEEKNVVAKVDIIDEKMAFHHAVINYAKKTNSDMIALAYHNDGLFASLEKYTQTLITNEENIPCLVVNAKLLSKLYY